jgi:hypothetical protein
VEQLGLFGQKIQVIHFVHGGEVNGQWRIACMPNMIEFHSTIYHPAYRRTNDHRAVTCPQCKESQVFRDVTAFRDLRGGMRGTPKKGH